MLNVIDNQDIVFHYEQVRAAGMIPSQLIFKRATFERGGTIIFEGAFDAPVIGQIGFSLKVMVKLLSNLRVIRFRIIETEALGIGLRTIVMKLIRKAIEAMVIPGAPVRVGSFTRPLMFPGITAIDDGKDIYFEYCPPRWVLLKDIQTDGNHLSIVAQGVAFPVLMADMKAAQMTQLSSSGSMADQVKLMQMQNPQAPVSGTGAQPTQIYPAPDLRGLINVTAKI